MLARQTRPVPLYAFVVDPSSLSRTVENLFYVSFLVNEGRAQLWWEAMGNGLDRSHLLLAAMEPAADDAPRARHQMVCSITEAARQAAIRDYRIQEPMIRFSPNL